MDKKLFKSILIIIAFTVLLVAVLLSIGWIFGAVGWLFELLSPVFIGFGIAFVLNRPYMYFLKLYTTPRKKKPKPENAIKEVKPARFKRKPTDPKKREKRIFMLMKVLSMLTVYIIFFAFVALFLSLVIPEITSSVSQISSNTKNYIDNLTKLVSDIEEWMPFDLYVPDTTAAVTESAEPVAQTVTLSQYLLDKLTGLVDQIPGFISNVLPDLFSFTKSLASSVLNFFLGLVMSVYMLASKESILRQIKRVFFAFIPKKAADWMYRVLMIANEMFSSFVNGRLFDALIVGMICFICMTIFGFPYTLLISFVIAITNIIPFFGPFIGSIPSIFLILLIDPMQAVWFTVFVIILFQVDGNLIGPKVVGDSIGLPAWWVMVSILVGGGLFGVLGMLAGVPAFAVIYKLLTETISNRLEEKGLKKSKEAANE